MASIENILLSLIGAFVGAAIGSFVAAAGIRTTTSKSIVSTPSSCDHCGQQLRSRDLIPIFSFLICRGRCRYCKSPLTWLYVGTEVSFAAIGALVASAGDWNPPMILACVAIILLGICVVSDFKAMLLPLPAMVAVGALGLVSQTLDRGFDGMMDSLIASAIAVAAIGIPGLLYWLIRRTQGFGEGDYWLMGAIGAWMHWAEPIILFYVATVICLLGAISEALIQGKSLQYLEPKPIGAFISVCAVIYLSAKLYKLELYFGLVAL